MQIDWAVVGATFLGPIVAVGITLWHQDRTASKERKTQLLRQLIFGRHLPGDPSYSLALTMIPIEFAHRPKVMEKYRAAKADLDNPNRQEQASPESVDKLVDLIVSMSEDLGYKFDHSAMRATGFVSQGLIARDNLYLDSLKAQVETAKHLDRSASVGEALAAAMSNQQRKMDE